VCACAPLFPQVALQIWTFFGLCQSGQEAEVRGRIGELAQRKGSTKVNAVQGEGPGVEVGDEDSEEEEDEEETEVRVRQFLLNEGTF